MLSMISTTWFFRQYTTDMNQNIQCQKMTTKSLDAKDKSLKEILSGKDGFDFIAQHLVKQFRI